MKQRFDLSERGYAVLTLHRPANVDQQEHFARLLQHLRAVAAEMPVVFPIHPRTAKRLQQNDLGEPASFLTQTEPLGYLDFLALLDHAGLVLTDSGGIQEETAVLGVPCFTLRDNTERPVTVLEGTNTLVGADGRLRGPPVQRRQERALPGPLGRPGGRAVCARHGGADPHRRAGAGHDYDDRASSRC